MKIYRQFIDEETISALKLLSLSEIQNLLSPSVDVYFGSTLLQVQNITIPVGPKKYVVIKNDWTDTPIEAHDYFFLEARITDKPHDIEFRDEGREHYTLIMDHLDLHIGAKSSVQKISVLEDDYTGTEERVNYDAGLILELACGKIIAIVRQESISGFLYIAHTAEDIAELTSDLKVRVTFSA